MENTEKLKSYIQRFIKGETPASIAFSLIEKDDCDGLAVLIDCGLDLRTNNYVFTAIDNSANKCFDLLLEKGANMIAGGRACNGNMLYYVEPLEYAVLLNNMNFAKKLVAHGVPLSTQGGIEILRKYRKCIGGENCDILNNERAKYIQNNPVVEL